MGATSVTGVGLGISNGLQKPYLHSGCACCQGKRKTKIPTDPIKIGCSVKVITGNLTRYTNGSGTSYKGC